MRLLEFTTTWKMNTICKLLNMTTLLVIIHSSSINAQQNSLILKNPTKNNKIVIKEKKRVRVKTTSGKKISGRFEIINDHTIKIRNSKIDLIHIEKIKRHPITLNILMSGGLIYAGSALVWIGVYANTVQQDERANMVIAGIGATYIGIRSPNFLKGYSKKDGWKIEISIANE